MPSKFGNWNRFFVLPILSAACGLVIGCGGDGEPRGTVSGTVTFKGTPVSEAIISFVNSETAVGAETALDSNGQYEIVGIEGGLPVGNYKITVSPPEVPDPNSPPDTVPIMMLKEMPNVPEQYRNVGTTPLTASLADGDNTHDFDLTDE